METQNIFLAVVLALLVGGGLAYLPAILDDDPPTGVADRFACPSDNHGVVSNATGSARSPKIWNNWITWYESLPESGPSGGGDVYAYHIPTDEQTPLGTTGAQETVPEIYGSNVYWAHLNRTARILDTGTLNLETKESKLLNLTGNGIVRGVWEDRLLLENRRGLGIFNRTTQSYTPISNENEGVTEIWEDHVVWVQQEGGGPGAVDSLILHDLSTGENTTLLETRHDLSDPDIYEDLVVYMKGSKVDDPSSTWDIYAYNVSTGEEKPIATGDAIQQEPRIAGDWIVFLGENDGKAALKAYRASTGGTVTIHSNPDVGHDVWRNRVAFIAIDEASADKQVALVCLPIST